MNPARWPEPAALRTLRDAWASACRIRAEEPYLIDARDGSSLTVAELDVLSRRAAAWLQSQGFEPGDRAVLVAAPTADRLVLLAGALRLGLGVALAHPDLPSEALHGIARSWKNRGSTSPILGQPAPGHPPGAHPPGELPAQEDLIQTLATFTDAPDPPETDPDADAVVVFSSGSTGPVRGVRLSWRACSTGINRVSREGPAAAWGALLGPGVREGVPAWLHTITGFRMSLVAPLVRGTVPVLLPPRASATTLLRLAGRHGATLLHTGPGFVRACLGLPSAPEIAASLRAITVGGGALSDSERQACADRLGVLLIHTYGLTETAGTCAAAVIRPGTPGPAGMGPPVVPTRIVRGVEHEPVGHIEVAPAHPCAGYVDGTHPFVGEATDFLEERALSGETSPPPRWMQTGDLGFLDQHGNLHVVGRAARTHVTAAGEKVQLESLEQRIRERLGVEVVVVSVRAPGRPATLGAVVEGREPDTAWVAAAVRALGSDLPGYCVPSSWRGVESFPKNAGGKIDILEVQRMMGSD